MRIKYYYRDHLYQLTELSEDQINLNIKYFSNINIPKKMSENSWKIFISDINTLKTKSKKNGRKEYFKESMEFSMIGSESLEYKIIPDDEFNRITLTKLVYLYRDLQKDGKYIFPIFMKSLPTKDKNIKTKQTSGLGKILISSRYFPNNNVDILISNRLSQIGNINVENLQEFLKYFCNQFNIINNLQVILQKYSDDGEYYVECMELESSESNFFDRTLESLELWEYIYNTVIDFEITNIKDYKILLDKIVLEGQKFIRIT
jgi:hypothetical protein